MDHRINKKKHYHEKKALKKIKHHYQQKLKVKNVTNEVYSPKTWNDNCKTVKLRELTSESF